MLAEGRRDDLAPARRSRKGAEVELKLVEVDLHDVGAAVGKLDGLDVVVADTAKLVGKKVKVVVGRVLDGQAFATLVDTGDDPDADHVRERGREADPRAPARRKSGEAAAEAAEMLPSRRLEPVADVAEVEEPRRR